MDRQLQIVQFIHPGAEFPAGKYAASSNEGECIRLWFSSEKTHHRRLVCHDGRYVDSAGNLKEGPLAFWTEWEAPAIAIPNGGAPNFFAAQFRHTALNPSVALGKAHGHALNGKACSDGKCHGKAECGCCAEGERFLNTDPCVFGRTFKYSNCHQGNDGKLRGLANGSLILFGSYKGHGKNAANPVFCLDTVFVVDGDGQDYADGDEIDCSDEYRNATLRLVDRSHSHTFYRGVCHGRGEVYSFTPAKLHGDNGYTERCVIENIEDLNPKGVALFTRNLRQNFSATEVDGDTVKEVWRKLVKLVRSQGFVMGVGFDWPKD